jgi:hypothetical protein
MRCADGKTVELVLQGGRALAEGTESYQAAVAGGKHQASADVAFAESWVVAGEPDPGEEVPCSHIADEPKASVVAVLGASRSVAVVQAAPSSKESTPKEISDVQCEAYGLQAPWGSVAVAVPLQIQLKSL